MLFRNTTNISKNVDQSSSCTFSNGSLQGTQLAPLDAHAGHGEALLTAVDLPRAARPDTARRRDAVCQKKLRRHRHLSDGIMHHGYTRLFANTRICQRNCASRFCAVARRPPRSPRSVSKRPEGSTFLEQPQNGYTIAALLDSTCFKNETQITIFGAKCFFFNYIT